MIILDTDHISALQYRDSPKAFALQARLEILPPDDIATTAITVEEQTRSWLGLIHRCNDVHRQVQYYDRLIGLFDFFADWLILPFDQPAAADHRLPKRVCPSAGVPPCSRLWGSRPWRRIQESHTEAQRHRES